jgi:hypothetical protein
MAVPTVDDRIAYIALSLYGDGAMSISGNIADQKLALQMLDHAAYTIRERLKVNPYAGLILPPTETAITPSPQYPALVTEGDLPDHLRANLRTQPLEVRS